MKDNGDVLVSPGSTCLQSEDLLPGLESVTEGHTNVSAFSLSNLITVFYRSISQSERQSTRLVNGLFLKEIYGMCGIITEHHNGLRITIRLILGDWVNVYSSRKYAPY